MHKVETIETLGRIHKINMTSVTYCDIWWPCQMWVTAKLVWTKNSMKSTELEFQNRSLLQTFILQALHLSSEFPKLTRKPELQQRISLLNTLTLSQAFRTRIAERNYLPLNNELNPLIVLLIYQVLISASTTSSPLSLFGPSGGSSSYSPLASI